MWLDAVLASPDLNWLTTDAEKTAWLASRVLAKPADGRPDAAPVVAPELRIHVTGTLPFGVNSSGRMAFFYLTIVPWTEGLPPLPAPARSGPASDARVDPPLGVPATD